MTPQPTPTNAQTSSDPTNLMLLLGEGWTSAPSGSGGSGMGARGASGGGGLEGLEDLLGNSTVPSSTNVKPH